jgi:hypothetical protein
VQWLAVGQTTGFRFPDIARSSRHKTSRPALQIIPPSPTSYVIRKGVYFPEVMRPECQIHHLIHSITEVKNVWNCIFTPPPQSIDGVKFRLFNYNKIKYEHINRMVLGL